jgi:hypothetical protein
MPIPTPHENEDSKKFVSRCMGDDVMKREYEDTKQRVAICISQTKKRSKSDLVEQVELNLLYASSDTDWDDSWDEWTYTMDVDTVYDEDNRVIGEAPQSEPSQTISEQKKKTKVTLNKPFRTPHGPKKFSVYVKNDKGNVVKVNFGDPDMEIKRDDPERRKSYRARHNCDNPGPKWKANYWSCKMWSNTKVSDLT